MSSPGQRHALGALFLMLGLAFAGGAWVAARAGQWIVLAAAAAIALWLAGLAVRGLKP